MTLALKCYEVCLGEHLLLAMHFLRHGEVSQEVHEGLTRQSSYLRQQWSALVVCPNFANKKNQGTAWNRLHEKVEDTPDTVSCPVGEQALPEVLGGIAVVVPCGGYSLRRYSRDYIPCSPCICWRHCSQPAGGNHRKSIQIMRAASESSIWNAKQLESEPPVYPALIFSGSLKLACLSIAGQARNS